MDLEPGDVDHHVVAPGTPDPRHLDIRPDLRVPGQHRVVDACRPMSGAVGDVEFGEQHTAILRCERTPVVEGAFGERLGDRSRRPGDLRETGPGRSVEPWDRTEQTGRIGMAAVAVHLAGIRHLHDASSVHHRHPVGDFGDHAQVVGDPDDRHAALVLESLHELDDLVLHGDVERRCGLVCDQQLRVACERHGDHGSLPHAAGELVRIVLHSPAGVGNADLVEQYCGSFERLLASDVEMKPEALSDLLPDRVHGVQRRHRILEDHPDLSPSNCAQLAAGHSGERSAIEPDGSRHLGGGCRKETHDAQRSHALPGARLTDEREHFTVTDIEIEVGHRIYRLPRRVEADREVLDREQRRTFGRVRVHVGERSRRHPIT